MMDVNETLTRMVFGAEQDPFPLYEELRETGEGVHWFEPLQAWLAFRYPDVLRTATEHDVFSNDIFWQSAPGAHDPEIEEHRRFVGVSSRNLLFMDPPDHTRLREAFRHAFTPRAIARMSAIIEQTVDDVLDSLPVDREYDFMDEFASVVPVVVVAAILGVPAEDRGKFREWSFSYASTFDPAIQGETRDHCIRQSLELMVYLQSIVDQRRTEPREDLITMLALYKDERGEPLTPSDLLAQLTILLAAGNETTTNLLGNGLTLMLDRPDVRKRFVEDEGYARLALEEILRIDPPLHLVGRITAGDSVLGGVEMPAGTMVFPVIAAANRDPRGFDQPDVFNPERQPNRHLAFNHGIHFCVGAPLARLEGQIALTRLLKRFPDISAGKEPAVRRALNIVSRGWDKRPVAS